MKYLWIIYLVISIMVLPFLILFARTAQQYISRAGGSVANIVIDTKSETGVIPQVWSALAQGGEEPPPMLKSVVTDVKALKPKYVRIDHIFDQYVKVSRSKNGLVVDFSVLDDTVNDILATGALPFFSLSYMPPLLAVDGAVTSLPSNWSDWEDLVTKTVEHYSGRSGKNLSGVFYEVWNEPDLFGKWTTEGSKDYRLLYMHTAAGANKAQNVSSFSLGGPATIGLSQKWTNDLLTYADSNNLRLDFYSWHRYSANPLSYAADGDTIHSWLSRYPKFASIPVLITEWGIDSENNPNYDNSVAASFEVAAVRQMLGKINYGFTFEIKDGPSKDGSAFWGRWGLITNDKAGLFKKPRYQSLAFLSDLKGKRLTLTGEGSWVSGIASIEGETIRVLLANYDAEKLHSENVPITFQNLPSASYTLKSTYVTGATKQSEYVVTSGTLSTSFIMNPNDVIKLELAKSGSLATFTQGMNPANGDQALILNSPLTFSAPTFQLSATGSIRFQMKPNWDGVKAPEQTIFDMPFTAQNGTTQHLVLRITQIGFSYKLVFGVFSQNANISASLPIDSWKKGVWQTVEARWSPQRLSLMNNTSQSQVQGSFSFHNGSLLTFPPSDNALDSLSVTADGKEIIRREFNGNTDQ